MYSYAIRICGRCYTRYLYCIRICQVSMYSYSLFVFVTPPMLPIFGLVHHVSKPCQNQKNLSGAAPPDPCDNKKCDLPSKLVGSWTNTICACGRQWSCQVFVSGLYLSKIVSHLSVPHLYLSGCRPFKMAYLGVSVSVKIYLFLTLPPQQPHNHC